MNEETTIRLEAVRIPPVRDKIHALSPLTNSIRTEGLHRAVTVWKDGTLISGHRRIRAHYLMERETIQAVFVDNIEDAAKRLLGDLQDETGAVKMTWTEVCRLWGVLRKLDEPAAAIRHHNAVQRGIELRRQTKAGKRRPGRAESRTQDYALEIISEPFGISAVTARRAELIYEIAYAVTEATPEKQEQAKQILAGIDAGESVWAGYQKLMNLKAKDRSKYRKTAADKVGPSAAATKQVQGWEKALPTLEGVVTGLVALGPPNSELTWAQVGPTHARLYKVRRDLEMIIKQMKGATEK